MQTNATVYGLILAFKILIPLGATVRVGWCCIKSSWFGAEDTSLKTRAQNAIIFTVLSECIMGFIQMVASYYS